MYDNNDSIVIGGTPSRFLAFTEHFRAVKTYLSCCKRIFESIAKLTSSLPCELYKILKRIIPISNPCGYFIPDQSTANMKLVARYRGFSFSITA